MVMTKLSTHSAPEQAALELVATLRDLSMSRSRIDEALALAEYAGAFQMLNSAGCYADDTLETVLANRVKRELAQELRRYAESAHTDVALVASELYPLGGHTSVVLRWLECARDVAPHLLILTRAIPESLRSRVEALNVPLSVCGGSSLERIAQILQVTRSAKIVVLHTHGDDIVAAIAARLLRELGCRTVLYFHADHAFSYGVTSVEIVANISSFGLGISERTKRVHGANVFLGVPLGDPVVRPPVVNASGLVHEPQTLLSCGSAYKYSPTGTPSFADIIDAILAVRPRARFVMVGPTGREPWWSGQLGRWGHRVEFLGPVSREAYSSVMARADVYVDSWPLTGGTAFPEALVAGIPVIGLRGPISGYTAADQLRVDNLEHLAARAALLLDRDPVALDEVFQTRLQVIATQGRDAFQRRVFSLYEGGRPSAEGALGIPLENNDALEAMWQAKGTLTLPWGRSLLGMPLGLRAAVLRAILTSTRMGAVPIANPLQSLSWLALRSVAVVDRTMTAFGNLRRRVRSRSR